MRTTMHALYALLVMIIFLYGKDTYRSRQYLQKMMDKFCVERDPQGLNLVRVDCDTTKENIMQQVLASPFLAEKRMVVLEGLLSTKQAAVQEALLSRIEEKAIPQDIILIISESIEKPKTKVAKALFERLTKEQFVQHFEELTGSQLTGWILAEVQERGSDIERDAAHMLASTIGGDMWKLSGVLDQLVSYAIGRKITSGDVAFFVEEKIDDNIFTLVDAIVQKQTARVFKRIQDQYRAGNDAGYIFAMIVRQYRILLELRDVYDRGEDIQSTQMAKALGLHPFVVKKSIPMVKRYSMNELEKIHTALLDLDKHTKTGKGSQAYLLDMFVGKLVM
ncbi:MAG: DNA polymerase III subunit delta [Candidatus Magasanikbacteria bacterium CG_4_9_14_0_2_um_filter_42_11]|uniref:DNA polymerase III subunit delta n=1 Tax=Candidatus Magasanikbacteria bacterium CG_4_9_14_0_2_um_filter_42_11 TaxID=1974643 RepID=A0A2M8F9G6_9BACT|nr:MAG: DNA polymerase III subunit delta [Candidatus Magasanikbacteria bacterium CG10_big_fil_rev_8_21_14_0_10_43_9]PIY92529.1 MAG: DNA polymerase III subunit delta [Candidatus Magasanikbacteria bacterium CG_4_10_14_0_8_um_filter_42_12]PJC52380.1 MAG: DNA polymerase III subunit delta [Candidatus Magasanikbacteria bacterium CG_4_9_14_0_2_um_filter_42_11]